MCCVVPGTRVHSQDIFHIWPFFPRHYKLVLINFIWAKAQLEYLPNGFAYSAILAALAEFIFFIIFFRSKISCIFFKRFWAINNWPHLRAKRIYRNLNTQTHTDTMICSVPFIINFPLNGVPIFERLEKQFKNASIQDHGSVWQPNCRLVWKKTFGSFIIHGLVGCPVWCASV